MTDRWSIDEIVTLRHLSPDDDLSELSKHIQKNGIKVPILVSTQKVVIDGLRRLKAAKLLGHKEVPVIVADTFETACAEITKARKHGIHSVGGWQRVWEIYRDTRTLMMDKVAMSRRLTAEERAKRPNTGNIARTRVALSEALGLKTVSILQSLTHVYMLAEQDTTAVGDRAREAVKRLSVDEITPYQADSYTRRMNGFAGDVTLLDDQRTLLASVTNTLSGVTKGMHKMGELSPGITTQELNAYLTSLRNSRREIIRFVRTLEEKAAQ